MRAEVDALQHLQTLHREEPQPHVEGHGRIGQVLANAAGHIEERLLKDVVRRDAACKAAVEADIEHAPQSVPVQREQLAEGLVVSGSKLVKKGSRPLAQTHQEMSHAAEMRSLHLVR